MTTLIIRSVITTRTVHFFPLLMALVLLRRSCSNAFVVVNQVPPKFVSRRLLPPPRLITIRHASVTGGVYQETDDSSSPTVTLFTKEGCTLCDKVKDVLQEVREELPHSLDQVDITDEQHANWFGKYKYDIPVLHLNGQYWLKHRTTNEEALEGLQEARDGTFQAKPGEPNAEAMERN
ncbi:chromosome 5 open reading frame 63 [Seminavis robusta]|uniref:Glutaredoxin-like protein n=1 Tax=Seminavis robusta TaxID=568900 RepID=A0A9N8EPJ7_9STRA|nr:chromosome 5 open reading frame 63 [Seminavis robusta]|eukprot:Sro1603_g285300.1 chromosome 5 open reading frame 63 (178) ;mRNA; r:10856-11389